MSANHFILVHHDGEIERVGRDDVGGHWLLRKYGETEKAFKLGGYAVNRMQAKEGALVYVERPMALFHHENDTVRVLEMLRTTPAKP